MAKKGQKQKDMCKIHSQCIMDMRENQLSYHETSTKCWENCTHSEESHQMKALHKVYLSKVIIRITELRGPSWAD